MQTQIKLHLKRQEATNSFTKLSLQKNTDKNILIWPQPVETKQQSSYINAFCPWKKGNQV